MTPPTGVLGFAHEVRRFAAANWEAGAHDLVERDRPGGYASIVSFRRKLGELGWLAMSWPRRHGGQDRSPLYQYALAQELAYRNAPFPHIALGIVAPILMRHANERQQAEFLPRIASGEIDFALGYSEPDAGTDLAALRTAAVRDGGEWVISGTKLWTSAAHRAEYCWLAARTDPASEGREGISLFIVDLRLPGIAITPIETMDGGRTNETRWDGVRVPDECLVGAPNEGWRYITEALALERLVVFPVGRARGSFDRLLRWHARERPDEEAVEPLIGRLALGLEACQLLSDDAAMQLDGGEVSPPRAALVKVAVTEYQQQLAAGGLALLGQRGVLAPGDESAPLGGEFELLYRLVIMPTFGAGSNDVLRALVARIVSPSTQVAAGADPSELAVADERSQLRHSIATMAERRLGPRERRRAPSSGQVADLWEAVVDLGLCGVGVPPELGGSGGTWPLTVAALAGLGKELAADALVSHVAACRLLELLADQSGVARERLAAAAAGTLRLTLHLPAGGGRAVEARDGRLHGSLALVRDALEADVLLTWARDATGTVLYAVPLDDRAVSIGRHLTTDGCARSPIELTGVAAEPLARGAEGLAGSARDLLATLDAAYALGVAEQVATMAGRYAAERIQFGRPLRAFQAVQLRLSRIAIAVAALDRVVHRAARAVLGRDDDAGFWAAAAAAQLCDSLETLIADAHQIHGGMGFAVEYPLQSYTRRAKRLSIESAAASPLARLGAAALARVPDDGSGSALGPRATIGEPSGPSGHNPGA